MRKFFYGTKLKILVSVCVALLLGIIIAAVSDGGASPVSTALSFVMTPLNSVSAELREHVASFTAGFRSASYYSDEAASLRAEVRGLREQVVDYEKMQQKLIAYEAFLEVKSDHPDYEFVPAAVVIRDPSDIYCTYTINTGSNDGVKINDPVIYGGYLVGIVKEVTPTGATVYSLLHPTVNVSAYEIRTREDCFTEPKTAFSEKGQLRISGLTSSTPVTAGGIVCTSGIGGIFPRDLIIGTVSEMVNNESEVAAYGIVTPDIDPSSLVDVFVITSFEGKTE